ncbi:heat shock protein beta-1-like isoform X3 [Penaeus japonicus]|uniref:heat shock protein beta-1-like isoform X3 n=1 Tax=Penaeus japonicus TaxID=27405 RepID=UPI001C711160|nr:heat shock protein beta-1-like isoform X3 [Penaeus japonicus]
MEGFKHIPVKLGDFSVIDQEFNSIREKFDTEMKKMEDEMARFRNELMNRESSLFQRSMLTSSRAETFSNSSRRSETRVTGRDGQTTVTKESDQQQESSGNQGSGSWLEGMNSPLIQQEGDCKQLKLRFDVSQYKPEEIVVKTVDNKLLVHAKHEEKSDNRSVYREYNREFLLPKGTNPELIKSSLSKDGVLTVEAPLPAIAGNEEKVIPIAQN